MKGYVCLFLLLVGTALFAQSNATPEEAAVLQCTAAMVGSIAEGQRRGIKSDH